MIDFEMTFPCYTPLQPNGMPFTFNAEGVQAIAVRTDDYILEQFFAKMFPNVQRQVYMTIPDKEGLCEWLSTVKGKPIAKGQPLTHVIIDPTPSAPRVRTHSIEDFKQCHNMGGGTAGMDAQERVVERSSRDLPLRPSPHPGNLRN